MPRQITSAAKRSVAINFTLPLELLAQADELARRAGVSRSEYLRHLIEEALEDAEDIAVAKERLADETDGWVSLDELKAEAGR